MAGSVWADEIADSRKEAAGDNEWTDEVAASAPVEKALRKKGVTSRHPDWLGPMSKKSGTRKKRRKRVSK